MLFYSQQFYGYNVYLKVLLLSISAFAMVVMPALWYLFLVKIKVIKNIDASDRKERKWAYFFTLLCYLGVAWFLCQVESMLLASIVISAAIILTVVTITNIFWKISAHATGISGLLGAVIYVGAYYNNYSVAAIIAIIIAIAAVCSARLILNAHTHAQLIAGTLLGLLGMFILPVMI